MGFLEIGTTEDMENQNTIIIILGSGENGILYVSNLDVHSFKLNHTTLYNNILGKWSKVCLSYDFELNEAQVAFNGEVSALVRKR